MRTYLIRRSSLDLWSVLEQAGIALFNVSSQAFKRLFAVEVDCNQMSIITRLFNNYYTVSDFSLALLLACLRSAFWRPPLNE